MMDFGDKGVLVVPVVMMNFGEAEGYLCEYLSTLILFFPGLSMRDVPAFSLVTAHDRKMSRIACNMTRVRKDMRSIWDACDETNLT